MYPNKTLTRLAFACWLAVVPLAMLATDPSWAQGNTTAPVNLKQAFDEAWLRQPEAQSLNQLREAAQARRDVAESWVAETPSLEAEANQGGEEYVAGVALPMWLPGERLRTGALAQAESSAVNSRAAAAQLRTAAVVRSAWWSWQLARDDQVLAKKRFSNTQRLAADVARRVNAGDLARADQHQADGAAAMAEFALFESNSVLAATAQNLRALTGYFPANQAVNSSEPLPVIPVDFSSLDASHPA
jgi:cobalt-zinc-cadmium efflux system outer membrane protein